MDSAQQGNSQLPHPSEYGVPHDEWRPGQLEAVKFCHKNRDKVIVIEAPTGSGKSAIGAALGRAPDTVRVLTKTKALQDQYRKYGFSVLFGMPSYQCALSPFLNADMCAYIDNMYSCPASTRCEYIIDREKTKEADRQALSYPYWAVAAWPKEDNTSFLYMDEAHNIPQIVMSASSIDLNISDLKHLEISRWPTKFKISANGYKKAQISFWLESAKGEIGESIAQYSRINAKKRDPALTRKILHLKRAYTLFAQTGISMARNSSAFYVQVSHSRLRIIPLIPIGFRRIFTTGMSHTPILTSATIGNPIIFLSLLGIHNGFSTTAIPNQYAPEQRSVLVPKGAPRMGRKTKETGYKKQADMISALINSGDPAWNGLVHTASKWHANDLAHRLASRIDPNRLWIVPDNTKGTNYKLQQWQNRLKKVPNTIAMSWAFHEGIDAPDTQINIIAKIPYAAIDEIEKARLELNPSYYPWRAATLTQQACGRVRRGPEDYDDIGGERKKIVAILDSNIWRLKNSLSKDFWASLTKENIVF